MDRRQADVLLERFNETIEKWIHYLDGYTFEMLCRQPLPGSWSLGQVYIHIIDESKYFAGEIKTCLLSEANSEKEKHTNATVVLAKNELPDMLIAGPSTDADIQQPQSKDELLQGLVSVRDEVNKLYSSFSFENAAGKTAHPGFQFFNALEWLQFAEIHMRHHFRQKKRIDERLFNVRT